MSDEKKSNGPKVSIVKAGMGLFAVAGLIAAGGAWVSHTEDVMAAEHADAVREHDLRVKEQDHQHELDKKMQEKMHKDELEIVKLQERMTALERSLACGNKP